MEKIKFEVDDYGNLVTFCPHGMKGIKGGGGGCKRCQAHVAMCTDIRAGLNTTGVVDCGYEEPVINIADEDILDRFKSHPVNNTQVGMMDDYRKAFLSLVQKVNELPGSREKSIVLGKLEDAQMYTTACIARRCKE